MEPPASAPPGDGLRRRGGKKTASLPREADDAPLLSIPMVQHRQVGFGEKIKLRGGVLLEQSVYQVFFPLSVPLAAAIRGRAACENMRFIPVVSNPGSLFSFCFGLVMSAIFWVPFTCWLAAGRASPLGPVFDVEIAFLIFATVFQRLAVATKYAFMPPDRYALFMTKRLPDSALNHEQLVTGWLGLPSEMLTRETQEAMRRLGFASDNAFFEVAADHLSALLQHLGVGEPEPDTVYYTWSVSKGLPVARVRASWVAQQLLRRGHAGGLPTQRRLRWINWTLAFVLGFTALVVRVSYGLPAIGSTDLERTAMLVSIATALGFAYVILSYQRTALGDYHMRASALRRMLALFSPRFEEGRDMVRASLARGVSYGSLAPPRRGSDVGGSGALVPPTTRPASTASTGGVRLSLDTPMPAPALPLPPAPSSSSSSSSSMVPPKAPSCCGIAVAAAGNAFTDDEGEEPEPDTASIKLATGLTIEGEEQAAAGVAADAPATIPDASGPCPRLLPHPLSQSVVAPIPLDCPNNAVAFLILRRIITQFGVRYFKRIQAYQSYSVILAIAVVVGLLINVSVSGAKVTGSSSTHSPASTASSALFAVQTLITGSVLGCYVSACLYYGAKANTLVNEHSAMLEARRVELEATAAMCPRPSKDDTDADADALQRKRSAAQGAAAVITSVIACMKSDTLLEPVCIVGVPASFAIAQTAFTALVSAVAAAAKLVFN